MKPGNLLVHDERHLAAQPIEPGRPVDRIGRGLLAADHFDQRQEIGRIERVRDDRAFRCRALGLNVAHGEARGARRDHHVLRHHVSEPGIEILLQFQVFRHAFLNELRIADGLAKIGRTAQAIGRRALRGAKLFKAGPGRLDQGAQRCFLRGVMNIGRDVVAMRQEVRRPAAADRPAAHIGDTPDVFRFRSRHVVPPNSG